MTTTKPVIDEASLIEFAKRHRLAELSLFGSILRDDFGPESDVDVCFALLPDEAMSIEKYIDMKDELVALFGRDVDIANRKLITNPFRRAEILNTRKIIYAA